MIDISYDFNEKITIYPNNPKFEFKKISDVEKEDNCSISAISFGSHTGTHLDAPSHFVKGGLNIDQIPLDKMNGEAKVFDLSKHSVIEKEILQELDICADDIVILKTDNSILFAADKVLDNYVTLSYDAAKYLSSKKIKMVGIDYMTIERPRLLREPNKSIHQILLTDNILILETLKLKEVIEGNYNLYCLPLKINGGDGCPVRVAIERIL